MKSTVVKMYDYKSWEIPAEITLWHIADGEIEQQLKDCLTIMLMRWMQIQ